jgi:uncharacterized protein YdbL (DUF1318 family)
MNLRFLLRALPLVVMVGCAADPNEGDQTAEDALSETVEEARHPLIEQARAEGRIGEQSTGYLGHVDAKPESELHARVSDINIKRRALYTDLSVRRGVTVEHVAHAIACELFRKKIVVGEKYRTEAGDWVVRTNDEPIQLPSFCE